MRKIALNVGISTAIFFVIVLFWKGNGFGKEALMVAAFNSVMFALLNATIQVSMILFRGPKN